MSYVTRPPAGRLRGLVDRLWHVEEVGGQTPETICPDGRSEIVLHLGDPMAERVGACDYRQPRHLLVSQMMSPITVVSTGRMMMVGARFAPDGLYRFTRISQARMVGQVLDLESVWSRWTRQTADAVYEASRPDERLTVLERALEDLLSGTPPRRSQRSIGGAVAELERTGGNASIDLLAQGHGMSRRQFERCFREQVGLPPRLFGRIVRFQRAFNALGVEGGADIAAHYGFADQAHLVHEIRRFAGRPPTALAEASGLTAFFRA